MILIASAAYVNREFQVEFGKLPPSFLPMGNRRLFERQVENLREHFPNEQIYLSLPESFELSYKDILYLTKNNVSLLFSDENLSLVTAIIHAIDQIKLPWEKLRLLHGDTLLTELPDDYDIIGIVDTKEDYQWEVEASDEESESVWCGYFSFSDTPLLRKMLAANESFTLAVRQYDSHLNLKRKKINTWYDFGHINTYFQSRTRITTERAFNSLTVKDGCVHKTGQPSQKITAEGQWFKNIPPSLRSFCPQLIDYSKNIDGSPYYVLEYLPLPPLNEVFVHGKNSIFYWNKLFGLCDDFLVHCQNQLINPDQLNCIKLATVELTDTKTKNRLDTYFKQVGFLNYDTPLSFNGTNLPSLRLIIQKCLDQFNLTSPIPSVMHGDFCLSNILFDSRSDRIKVIDPRGLDAFGNQTIFGDLRYDLAKLTHSVVGLYDHIIAGAFEVEMNTQSDLYAFTLNIHIDERTKAIQSLFINKTFINVLKPLDVIPLTILLFLSMLPLHADNQTRQMGLFANALRLYVNYLKKESSQ